MKRFLLVLFVVSLNSNSPTHGQTTIHLATGPRGGVYFSLGVGIKAAIETADPEITVALHPSEGSVENAWLLSNNEVQLALIQNDIASDFRKGERMFKFPSENMMAIASLYTDVIHIIARKDLNIKKMSDLRGKTVAVGEQKSGTQFNAATMLSSVGIEYEDITEKFLSFENATDALLDGSIDAAFFTTGIPTPAIEALGGDFCLLEIEDETVTRLRKSYPLFIGTTIPASTYAGQNRAIPSLGVKALFVARRDVDHRVIKKITEAIFTGKAKLVESHEVAKDIDFDKSHDVQSLQLHPGAEFCYQDRGIIKRSFSDFLYNSLYVLVLSLTIALSIWHRRRLRRFFFKNMYFQLSVVLAAFFVLGTLGTFLFEKDVNENFDNILEAFWTTMVYLLSGFEGSNPMTLGGKISSILILIGSVGVLGSVAGNIAAIFIKERGEKMPKNPSKHIAMCNWNRRGDAIIHELRKSHAAANKEIIILADSDVNEKELRKRRKYYDNVFFIKGDPTSHEALKCARVPYAQSVIILSNEEHEKPDPSTVLTCLAIDKLSKRLKLEEKPHIVVELMDSENRELALDAGANEIVSAGFYRTGIMLQSALYPGLSDIFHELLSYGENKTSVFIIPKSGFPKSLLGKTFQEASEIINRQRYDKNTVVLIGVRRKNKVILNPLKGTSAASDKIFDRFEEGDTLVVLSDRPPDLSKLQA